MQDGHSASLHLLDQADRVLRDVIREDHRSPAGDERGQALPDDDVERLGAVLGEAVVVAQTEVRDLPQDMVDHPPMRDHHPLGIACGAGGEHHVGEVFTPDLWEGLGRRLPGQLLERHDGRGLPADEAGEGVAHRLGELLRGQDQGRAAAVDDLADRDQG